MEISADSPHPGQYVSIHLLQIADVDRVIHEPARLMIAATLYSVKGADFLYLQSQTGLTKGNLSSHLAKLEQAGYVEIQKTRRGRIPLTVCRLTAKGRTSFRKYGIAMQEALSSSIPTCGGA